MPAPAGISTDTVAHLLKQGFSQAEIAEQLQTTRQAVRYHAKKIGWTDPTRAASALLPWNRLTPNERRAAPYVMLRTHVEYMLNGGKTLSEDALRRLRSWYDNKIKEFDVVVEYDPNILPTPGQKYGGFRYVAREESDGDLLVRRNEFTKLNKTHEALFRFPSRLPEV